MQDKVSFKEKNRPSQKWHTHCIQHVDFCSMINLYYGELDFDWAIVEQNKIYETSFKNLKDTCMIPFTQDFFHLNIVFLSNEFELLANQFIRNVDVSVLSKTKFDESF